MESVPKLRKKQRDWSKVDPNSLTAALGWDRMLAQAPAGAMQEESEEPDMAIRAIKAGNRNNSADQARINKIPGLAEELADLADELIDLADELGAQGDDDSAGDTDDGEPIKALSLEQQAERIRRAFMAPIEAQIAKESTLAAAPFYYWVREVYSGYVILEHDGTMYRAPYTTDLDGEITPSGRDQWQKVEAAWVEAKAYAAGGEIKAIDTANPYKLRGSGIIRGGRDLVGDAFDQDTDLGLTRSPIGMPVYYDHAMRGIKSQVGVVTAWEDTGDTIDFEIELDRRKAYIDQVLQLESEKALGLSTGAVSHLVIRKNGALKRWIVGELSLTPTPAESRTHVSRAAQAKTTTESGRSPESEVPEAAHIFIIL